MTDRELRRLSRIDLLNLLLRYAKKNRALKKEIKLLRVEVESLQAHRAARKPDAGRERVRVNSRR